MSPLLVAAATLAASLALLTDLRSRRIPNWLTGSTLLAGLLLNLWAGGLTGSLLGLAGAALGFGLLVPFYALRGVGAGDVKLMAALGAVLGPLPLLAVALYGALAGGLLSLVVLGAKGRLPLALHQVLVMHVVPTPSGAKAPYAVAIAAGVYAALLLPALRPIMG